MRLKVNAAKTELVWFDRKQSLAFESWFKPSYYHASTTATLFCKSSKVNATTNDVCPPCRSTYHQESSTIRPLSATSLARNPCKNSFQDMPLHVQHILWDFTILYSSMVTPCSAILKDVCDLPPKVTSSALVPSCCLGIRVFD